MKGTTAVLERWAEAPEAQYEKVQLSLSQEEAGLVKTSLQTLLMISTRHEGYGGIHHLLAKLGVAEAGRSS